MRILSLFVAIIALIYAAALADVVELKTGKIQGNIRRTMTPRETYEAWLATLKDDDKVGHLALAEYCKREKLSDEMRAEFAKVLKIDPDNERARKALGYVRSGDQWVTEDELNRSKGFVEFRGQWVSPEYKEQILREEAEKRFERRFQELAYRIAHGAREVIPEIEAVRDPYAFQPLVGLLRHEHTAVRLAAVNALSAYESLDARRALVDAAVTDNDETVRKAIVAKLAARHPREAIALFSQRLDHYVGLRLAGTEEARQTQRLLVRLAHAVGGLGDPLSILLLIRMLHVQLNMVDDQGEIPPQAYFTNLAAADELQAMTGERFYDSRQAWLAWWCDHGYDLVGDAWDEDIDRLR